MDQYDGQAQEPVEEDPEAAAQRAMDFDRLCETIKTMRDRAVKGREESGIEKIWLEDQEFYDGIDDANRNESGGATVSKPSSISAGLRLGSTEGEKKAPRSSVFVEITRPYVDAAAARVADMLLPTDDRNFAIENTPVPDLIEKLKSKNPVTGQGGQPVMMPAEQAQQPPAAGQPPGQQVPGELAPGQAPMARPMTIADQAREIIQAAKKSAEKAQTRIDDWLTESMFLDECRLVVDDAARCGAGVLKGPIPKKTRKKAVIRALQGIGIVIKEEITPSSGRVDFWNFYPDPDCGEDIQRGKFTFELDQITGRELGNLKGMGYLDEIIDEVLEEGPTGNKDQTGANTPRSRNDGELYKIWYFHGYLSAEDLDLLGEAHGAGEQFPVMVTMVNDKIIKAALSPLDSGEFPYDVFTWQRRPGHWAGKGVARQMRTEQRGVNAATRCLMDNMGQSSRPYKVINRAVIDPTGDPWTFNTAGDAEIQDVSRAMMFFNAPSNQVEIMRTIEFWMKRAEDATGLPMLLQGQMGRAPDTLGGMQLLNNNASTVLRRLAKNYDARITERHIGRYYEWLLIHGKDDSEKGDFTIKARGSSALIERDMQAQVLMQAVGLSLNPRYGLDPKKIMAKFLKSQRLNVDDLELDEAEAAKMAQGGPPPQVQAAQVREQAETERFAADLAYRKQQDEVDNLFRQWEKEVDSRLEAARLDGDKTMSGDKLRTDLAQTALKLKTQIRLAMETRQPPQVAAPAFEPQGRAPVGMAFQR